MKAIGLTRIWRDSIRWKLVAVLIAVSVLPMLVTSQIAASVVSAAYTENVETWLVQIGRFFLASVRRGGEEIGPAIGAEETRRRIGHLAAKARNGEEIGEEQPFLDALGFDLLTLREPDGRLLWSNLPVEELKRLPFEGAGEVYLFRGGGRTVIVTGQQRSIETRDGPVEVFAGSFLDASFIENIETIGALDLNLFYAIDGTFRPVYSSSPKTVGQPLDAALVARLESLPKGGFIDEPDSGDGSSIGVLIPIRSGQKLVGAVACSLDFDLDGMPIVGTNGLLWLIFATGMAIAVLVGIALSSLVTRRVAKLVAGVDAVATGDFSQHIAVDGSDELDRLAVAFNAMSAQLQDYRQLQARLRRKERFATLGEVAAGFAHEVRNPLGIIKTTAELVQKKPELTDPDRRRLGYVAEEVRRIDRLIRDFLVFARPAQRTATIAAADLVERALGFCREEIERRGVELAVADRSDGALLAVDLDQIVQAVLNLVLNALDAIGEGGGRLRIVIGPPAGGNLPFVLHDSGPGIPPDLLERIFDPFVTTKPNGTGLGLATVFAIVEGHGGWIEARNPPEGGALFELTLPVVARTGGEREP